ncbi:MAG: radical SAM protein [Bacteroidales bacterium]|nr:radical SAM protein [Bacteroidales bacterium]
MDFATYDIKNKIETGIRLTEDEVFWMFENFSLHELSFLSLRRKKEISGNYVFFNRNIHIEPTNYCIHHCTFCYFRANHPQDGYILSETEIIQRIKSVADQITEVHITGGIIPDLDLQYYKSLFRKIKKLFPHISIKALTAIELQYLSEKEKISLKDLLTELKDAGLNAIPGGGAELFDEKIRQDFFPEKLSAREWLNIHKTAHQLDIPSNATMLMGLGETIKERIHHLSLVRSLQDETHGFHAFIPLLFRSPEKKTRINIIEIMKTFAIARLFLDNIPHLKAYWPSLGIDTAQIALLYGADDLDGTIFTSTVIYQRTGSMKKTHLSLNDIVQLIKDAGFLAVERDTTYQIYKQCVIDLSV